MTRSRAHVSASQIRILLSSPDEAIALPSGEKSTAETDKPSCALTVPKQAFHVSEILPKTLMLSSEKRSLAYTCASIDLRGMNDKTEWFKLSARSTTRRVREVQASWKYTARADPTGGKG